MPTSCGTAAMFRSILPTEKRKPSTHVRPAPGRESKLTACWFLYSTLDAARLTKIHPSPAPRLSSEPRSSLETSLRKSNFFCFVRVVLIPTLMKNIANKSEKNCFTLPIQTASQYVALPPVISKVNPDVKLAPGEPTNAARYAIYSSV